MNTETEKNHSESPKKNRGLAISRSIAWLLDSSIKIPGTNKTIGIDPILGLLPGFGDTASNVLGGTILVEALRSGANSKVMVKMVGNLALNAIVGSVPLVGDIFSLFFKSNVRNQEILEHLREGNAPPADRLTRWTWYVILGVLLFALVAIAALVIFVIRRLLIDNNII